MLRAVWQSLVLTPALFTAFALAAVAEQPSTLDQVKAYSQTETSVGRLSNEAQPSRLVGQVTSVSQLSDVRPTDWAFQALQSLVERYGCIAGYPDRTFRGNRATTRFEFAAGLNACLNRVNELIAAATTDLVKKEDLATLQKLQEEFAAELATVRGQVDSLEARTTTLERQQFSTTTKLSAEVILTAAQAFGERQAVSSGRSPSTTNVQQNTIAASRVRISFDTSFTGRDRLRTQLQARNITQFNTAVTGTNMTRLGFDGGTTNSVELRRLEYRLPLGDQTTVFIGTGTNDGLEFNDSIPTLSPFESSGSGAISRFGRFNPILRAGTGTGLIVNHRLGREFTLGNRFTLSLGYLVPTGDAQDPSAGRGLFNGNYAAIGQLVYQATPNLGVGFTYANAYYSGGAGVAGSTGSTFANNPFNGGRTATNQYGVQANIRLNPSLTLAGWAGYTEATLRTGTSRAEIWNWAVGLAFPDLFREGNLGGLIFGMPPKATGNDVAARRDRDTSYHLEGFYRYRLNDNIAITPGVLVIFNPEHNSANSALFVGTLRTTFTF